MNEVFFKNGTVTSTEANYLCSIAQESIRKTTDKLENLVFYNTEISVIGNSDKQQMSRGIVSIDFIDSALDQIAKMNSLTAWLREAIKNKEEALVNIVNKQFEEYIYENNIRLPEVPKGVLMWSPTQEIEIINSWDINKRNKYYKLEAFASTYGKYIHINRPFSNARKTLHNVVSNPIITEGTGRDLIIYYRTPTISSEEVDKKFYSLESKYRTYEKELNKLKAEIKESCNNEDLQKSQKYQDDLAEYRKEYEEYTNKLYKLKDEFKAWKVLKKDEISRLKIAIPSEHTETLQYVRELGNS